MSQRAVTDGEIIRAAWSAEDARREGHRWIHPIRTLPDGRKLLLCRLPRLAHLVVVDDAGDDIYDYSEPDACWRSALGWNGEGKPKGYSHYRRRA